MLKTARWVQEKRIQWNSRCPPPAEANWRDNDFVVEILSAWNFLRSLPPTSCFFWKVFSHICNLRHTQHSIVVESKLVSFAGRTSKTHHPLTYRFNLSKTPLNLLVYPMCGWWWKKYSKVPNQFSLSQMGVCKSCKSLFQFSFLFLFGISDHMWWMMGAVAMILGPGWRAPKQVLFFTRTHLVSVTNTHKYFIICITLSKFGIQAWEVDCSAESFVFVSWQQKEIQMQISRFKWAWECFVTILVTSRSGSPTTTSGHLWQLGNLTIRYSI